VRSPTHLEEARHGQRWFWLACASEAALGGLAVGLLWWQDRLPGQLWRMNLQTVALGVGATLPLFLFFHRAMTISTGPLLPVRRFLEEQLRPTLRSWSVPQLAIVALLAGVGEELLFRGAIQGWVGVRWGSALGLVTASVLFGAAHSVNGPYALVAGVMGMYLGLLLEVSGSLLCPVLTHAGYDFVALWWFLSPAYRPLTETVANESPNDGGPVPG
jgi:membrane protease YdiL (CAAX protease family)